LGEIAARSRLTITALGERVERIIAAASAAHGPGVTHEQMGDVHA
jgi:hypothetical protein